MSEQGRYNNHMVTRPTVESGGCIEKLILEGFKMGKGKWQPHYKGQNYYRENGEFVHDNCKYCGERFWKKVRKGLFAL